VRTIVRDLRMFSRPAEEKAQPTDVEKVLESSINMAMSHICPRAQVERHYGSLQPTLADESRLGQVFLNLLVNAAQAIPEGAPEKHRSVVRTREGGQGRGDHRGHGQWRRDGEVEARAYLRALLDRQAGGRGNGLGLSIVHGIVTGMGGEITVRSEVGRGSTFRVCLLVRPARAEPQEASAPARRGGCAGRGCS
jgi:signal transduction histidine kinase